ncbi:hypothetical protein ACHAW6_007024 [Cyclotella cf. meneghiniana]
MAKKAFQTFKDHFLAILSGVDSSFPPHLWDRLLSQAEMTLNLLRQLKVAPKLSAWAYLFGPHDYDAIPLALLGCAVQVRETPGKCKSWDLHSSDGWYIETSHEHYRCFRVYKKETRADVSDMVYFKHKYIMMPTAMKADEIITAAQEISVTLQRNLPSQMPAKNYESLKNLSKIYGKVVQKKIPEANWEKPVVARVLGEMRMGTTLRVTEQRKEPAPLPTVVENMDEDEGLIVASSGGSAVVKSVPAYNTRARSRPMMITQESINEMLRKYNAEL